MQTSSPATAHVETGATLIADKGPTIFNPVISTIGSCAGDSPSLDDRTEGDSSSANISADDESTEGIAVSIAMPIDGKAITSSNELRVGDE